MAADLAQRIGVDEFVVARPHSVAHDDPHIKVAETAAVGEILFSEPRNWCGASEREAAAVNTEV
ncbi:hypothetical protein B4Q13_24760, partial [Lacticaseibacillus rhamnosus]